MRTLIKPAAAAVLVAIFAPFQLAAQQPAATARPAQRAKKKETVKVEPWLAVEAELDNNVFLLTPARKSAVDNPSAADAASGRFAGMESAADVIVQARGGVGLELDGLGGRALTLSPAIQYDFYTKNGERSNLTASVALAQALARGMRTKLEMAYTPSYFPKNYLLDATDANGDGRIAAEERRYAPADYSALDVELAHRLRLKKSSKRSPLGAELDLGAGYYTRSYDSPFAARDVSGPTLRATLDLAPGDRVDMTAGYSLEMLSSDEAQEVLILDEIDASSDLNGNGTATDLDVRTVQLVDRSRREHEFTLGARFAVARRTDLRFAYGLRLRDYLSDLPLDLAHRDRRDTRHELRGELATRVARGTRFTTGARYARQTANRLVDSDLTDEADDYTRLRAFAGLRVEF
ncbi:MAG: hypothetical protein NUW01_11830 [Gemmatimonadaceae bacterium]|nr:hypothetical protein [Gemmatimonadaceae bacterium]